MLKFARSKVKKKTHIFVRKIIFIIQKNGMNRQEFGELLSYVGLGADQNLGNKLFQYKKIKKLT